MVARDYKQLRLVTAPSEPSRLLAQGLVDLHKAVKGAAFYPKGHPSRIEPLQRSFKALRRLVEQRELVLTVNRHGFTPGVEEGERRRVVLQLAHECLIRRIASITLLPDLLPADLEAFVDLLSSDPHRTASLGGFARQLQESGVQTIWINEKDIAAVWAKRALTGGGLGEGGGAEIRTPVRPAADDAARPADGAPREAGDLLRLMAQEKDDARYQELGRELMEGLRGETEAAEILPVLHELLRQHQESARGVAQREYALFVLERLADGASEPILQTLEGRNREKREAMHRLLAALGAKGAYWLIPRLCLAEGLFERKALARALVRVGAPAVGPVMDMLKDERWYVVRNMAAILGELGAQEAVLPLKRALYHTDLRVRKEGIRALMKIGGEAAESMLIVLLEDADETIVRQAIHSLGLMRSRQAVPFLMKLLERGDLLLKRLELKKELVLALGRVADHRATPLLLKMLGMRGFPAVGRWLELKVAVASALGVLGDEAALPKLLEHSAGGGALAEACREAIDAIERVSGGGDD